MNQLMASEMSRAGMKQASEEIQAFKDHQEYLDVLRQLRLEVVRARMHPKQ
jgi:hypothetical protein